MTKPPQGIKFGGRMFTEPVRFPWAIPPPPFQGIYAILAPDDSCKPRPFRVLYIGESQDVPSRVTTDHERYPDWVREAVFERLYVATHYAIMTAAQRKAAVGDLIASYKPACNDQRVRPRFSNFTQGRKP